MAVAPPPPVSSNPLKRVALELAAERRSGGMPPGDTAPSVSRTRAMIRNPLGLLLDLYERRGPVFSVRILHANNVFVLGPEANHFVLVSGAKHFGWRDGGFGDLIPLLGDGLLTIDGDFHRSSRRTMLPAFHHERIAGYRAVMEEEAARGLEGWRDGETLDVYAWARALALRVAMRALFGFDPDAGRGATDAARDFERALSYYGEDYWLQVLRGPRTPVRAADRLAQAARRARLRRDRAAGARRAPAARTCFAADGHRALGPARPRPGDDAAVRRPRHDDRDDLVPVLGARRSGRTGTTSTPRWTRRCACTRRPGSARAARSRTSSCTATASPPGVPVNYCSWASHRLPDVWEDPHAFRPERFLPRRAREDPARRLRPVRRRLADLPRDALRPARDLDHRGRDPRALHARAAARAPARDPPDADARARAAGCRCGCVRAVSNRVVPCASSVQ